MVSYNNSNVLKFSVKDFKEQDAPNLIMNIWIYNSTHVPTYFACRTYTDHYKEALREKWESEWGDFNFAIAKFKKCDRNFIDTGQYSSADMHSIIEELKRFNKHCKKH